MPFHPVLEEIFANLDRLPHPSAVALQVNQMMDNPAVTAEDLAQVIMIHLTLTTKVLKLCNAARLSLQPQIRAKTTRFQPGFSGGMR